MENKCPSCGAMNAEGVRFCEKCGVSLAPPEVEDEPEEERLTKTNIKQRKWRIVNSWQTLIGGAQGKEAQLAEAMKRNLQEVAVPDLLVEHRSVKLSGIASWLSGRRRQLVIENKKLMGYHFFLSVTDYGKQLSVAWYLMVKKNFATRLLAAAAVSPVIAIAFFWLTPFLKLYYGSRGYAIPELMDMFELEELSSFTTTAHRAVTKAVEKTMSELGMDFSKMDTKSRGFLNVS